MRRQGLSARRAFTLIELMIVIVIVAILAMSAIPFYQENIKGARMAEGVAGVGTIRTALSVYAASNNNKYPKLDDVDGSELGILNIAAVDLIGKFFGNSNYNVKSKNKKYTITATDHVTGLTYEINQDGVETTGDGYYATGQ